MPRWNNESLEVYKENVQTVIKAQNISAKHWYKFDCNEEHVKIHNLCKYAYFNSQLTTKQLGWLKAYIRRNVEEVPTDSSTQLADSSTISVQ